MGNARSINYGRKPLNTAGLEFASSRKPRFAQYTQTPNAPAAGLTDTPLQQTAVQQPASVHNPVAQPMYAAARAIQPNSYKEVAHDKVLYPQLSPIDAIEVPVLPDDTITNDIAFDVADTLDENDEFFADMPKSSIKRPGEPLKEEVQATRKKGLKRTMAALGMLAGVAVLVVSWSLIQRYSPPVNSAQRKKAGYPVYQMQPNTSFALQKGSVEFNENSSLVYKVKDTSTDGSFVLSQQKLPEVVKDDASFAQFLTQTDKFASFDTPLGKAYLTKPQGTGTDVSVVLRSGTTLLFIRGPGDTSEQAWAKLVSTLKLQ